MNLDGVFLPVTTPFDAATGDLDLDAFAANIRAWCEHPIAGLVVGGSTGEQALLDEDELLALVARGARSRGDGMAFIVFIASMIIRVWPSRITSPSLTSEPLTSSQSLPLTPTLKWDSGTPLGRPVVPEV